jgi:uncharacterized protein
MVKTALLLIFNFVFLIPAAAQSFPKATGRVNDFANVIDANTEADIDRQLDLLEQKTSSEIAVATIKSLGDMSVEEYANKLFKEWGVGRAKQDNGVLVLVAPNDRKIRIEVGYGLEGVLPDGLAGEVIRDQFTPKFKSDDYSGGIKDGVDRLVQIVEKHQVLTPEELARFNASNSSDSTTAPWWIFVPFLGLFIGIGFTMLGIGIATKTIFPLVFGALFGGLPLILALLLATMVSLFTVFPLAVFAIWFGNRMGRKSGVLNAFRKSATSASGWTMGTTESSSSSSDSDSSSSSSSSSDSDYGGGSSGGGGASGSW